MKDGVAHLLLELVKGVSHGFHSRAPEALEAMLVSVRPTPECKVDAATLGLRFDVVGRALALMCKHARAGTCVGVWEALLKEVQAGVEAWEGRAAVARDPYTAALGHHITRLCSVVRYWASFRAGDRVGPEVVPRLLAACRQVMQGSVYAAPDCAGCVRSAILHLLLACWRVLPSSSGVQA